MTGPAGEPEAAGADGAGGRADRRGAGPDRARVAWGLGLTMYVVEAAAVGFLALLFGGLSAMLADTCFRGSTELICEPRWQTIMAATPITAFLVTVVTMAALLWWRRGLVLLGIAMVVTPVVPLVAFLVMEAVVTA